MKPQEPIVLDGQIVDNTCVFGDGEAQFNLYYAVKEYIANNPTDVRQATMPDKKSPQWKRDVVMAESQRYNVIAVCRYAPHLSRLIMTPRYQVQIKDKQTKHVHVHMGTMAHMMFDLLKGTKGQTR